MATLGLGNAGWFRRAVGSVDPQSECASLLPESEWQTDCRYIEGVGFNIGSQKDVQPQPRNEQSGNL